MNIWIINHYAILPTSPGGTRHYDLSRALAKKGHQITIFSAGFHYSLLKDFKIEKYNSQGFYSEKIDDINWVWIKTTSYEKNNWKRVINMLSFYHRLKKIGKKLPSTPNIIIGSTVHPFAPLAGISLAKNFNVPFVFEIRDLWPQTMIDMSVWSKTSLNSKFFFKIEAKTIKNSDGVIALSPLTKDYLIQKYNYKNVEHIPNGIDIEKFDTHLSDANENSTIEIIEKIKKQGIKTVFFTGTINISNNIDLLIKTAEILQNKNESKINIIIIGTGQEKQKYLNLIKDKKLTNIQILEPVNKSLVPVLLSLADGLLLIQGKVMWGSMNKLFDYLASGKPIISAVEASHNNPLNNLNSNLHVTKLNANNLFEKIIALKNMSQEQKDELKLKARNIILEKYDIKLLAEKLDNYLINIKK